MHVITRAFALPGTSAAATPLCSISQRSLAVRSRQQTFEGQPPEFFLSPAGRLESRQIADERCCLARLYQQKGLPRDAGLELRFAAYCLEISVIRPLQAGCIDSFNGQQLDSLNEAIKHRYSAAREFRLEVVRRRDDWRSRHELALEISFLAKTLTFSRAYLPWLNSPKGLEMIVTLRLESAGLFSRLEDHTSALYEYRHLAVLCKAAGDERAVRYARRALDELPECNQTIPNCFLVGLRALILTHREQVTPTPSAVASSSAK